MGRTLAAAVVVLAAALPAACSIDVRGEEIVLREERRFTVGPELEMALATFDGALEIRSWDRPEVLVEIERRAASGADAQALEVRTTQEGNRLTIDVPDPRRNGDGLVHIGSGQSPSVNLRVTAPARLALEARSGDGPIAARDLFGRITLRTDDGAISTDHLGGTLTVDTRDGPVVARDVQGHLELHTGDGAVEVSGALESLRITTGDGPVRLDAHQGSAMQNDWSIQTGDGAISVRLPGTFDAELDARSSDGRITVSGIGSATPSDDDDRPAQLRTRLGNGGSTLRISTGDGPITVNR